MKSLSLESLVSLSATEPNEVIENFKEFDRKLCLESHDQEFLIEHYIPKGETGVFHAAGGSYKSLIVLDWARCVCLGVPWYGRAVESGRVLYVSFEDGITTINDRLKHLLKNNNQLSEKYFDKLDQNFNFIDFSMSDVNMIAGVQPQNLYRLVKDKTYSLIIIDTLRRFAGDLDENSSGEMSKVLKIIAPLAGKSSVIILHHNNKTGGIRGSTALSCNTRFVISMNECEEKTKRDDRIFALRVTKNNHGATGKFTEFRFRVEYDTDNNVKFKIVREFVTDSVEVFDKARIFNHIKKNHGLIKIKEIYFDLYGRDLKSDYKRKQFQQELIILFPTATFHNQKITLWNGDIKICNGFFLPKETTENNLNNWE